MEVILVCAMARTSCRRWAPCGFISRCASTSRVCGGVVRSAAGGSRGAAGTEVAATADAGADVEVVGSLLTTATPPFPP